MREQVRNWLFFALTVLIGAAFVYVARYALPKTDDFGNLAQGIGRFKETGSATMATLRTVLYGYNNQQGTFFSCFVATFLLLKVGIDAVKFRYVVMAFVVFFFVALAFALYIIARYFRVNSIWGVFLFAFVWTAMDCVGPGESLMFITGIAVYGFPIALSFLSIAFYALLLEAKQTWKMILFGLISAGCAFLACGGVLMVAAMTNMLMVLFAIHSWYRKRQFPVRGIVPFLFAFGSALANALAPGNFVRYQNAAGDGAAKPDFVGALLNTFGVTNEQFGRVFSATYVFIALVLIALVVLFSKRELDDKEFRVNPLFFFVGSYFLAYIVMFPSVLGYDMVAGGYIQERTVFAFTQAATFGIIVSWTYLMFWWKANYNLQWVTSKAALALGCLLLVVSIVVNVCYVPIARGKNSKPTLTEIYEEATSGALDEYYAQYRLVFWTAISTKQNGRCNIQYEIEESKLFTENSFSSDPNWWVCYAIAQVYELEIFAYIPGHEFSPEDYEPINVTMDDLRP